MTASTGIVRPISPHRIRAAVGTFAVVAIAMGLGAFGGQRPELALALGVAALAAVICLTLPDVTTYLVVAVLYSNAAAVAVNQHGLPYFVGIAFPVPLVVPLAFHLIIRREVVNVTSAMPIFAAYLLVQLVGAAGARDVPSAFDQVTVFLISGIGLYFVITNVVRSLDMVRRLVWVVLLVAACLGTISGIQTVTGDYGNTYFGFGQINFPGRGETQPRGDLEGIPPRLTGPIGEVNRYAQVMLVVLPLGGLLAWAERRRAAKAAAVGLTLLVLIGMGSTFSRGAALGLVIVLLGAVAFRYLRPQHLAGLGVALAIVFVAFPRYGERLLDLQAITRLDASAGGAPVQGDVGNLRGRATESLAALLAFGDHPLVGVGPGLFPSYYQQYAREVSAASIDTRIDIGSRQAHNLYAGILAEYGGLGFACFMGIILVTMRDLLRARRRLLHVRPDAAHLATGFLLAILGYMGSGMTLHLAFERYYWILIALAGATAHLALQVPIPADAEAPEGVEPRRSPEEGRRAPRSTEPRPSVRATA